MNTDTQVALGTEEPKPAAPKGPKPCKGCGKEMRRNGSAYGSACSKAYHDAKEKKA